MIDREKVIKGLEEISDYFFSVYHHSKDREEINKTKDMCDAVEDALTLLKEQEAEWIEYPECLAYDGAYSDSHIVCSACKHVFDNMDNCTEEFDYCPHCGAKMK